MFVVGGVEVLAIPVGKQQCEVSGIDHVAIVWRIAAGQQARSKSVLVTDFAAQKLDRPGFAGAVTYVQEPAATLNCESACGELCREINHGRIAVFPQHRFAGQALSSQRYAASLELGDGGNIGVAELAEAAKGKGCRLTNIGQRAGDVAYIAAQQGDFVVVDLLLTGLLQCLGWPKMRNGASLLCRAMSSVSASVLLEASATRRGNLDCTSSKARPAA